MRQTLRSVGWRVRVGLIAWCVCAVGGCGPSVQGLRVEVRDAATKEPAAGVTVFADVPSRDHPFSIATLLKQTGPLSWRAKTDEHGVAELKYAEGRPVRVGVLSAGWAVGAVMVDRPEGAWEISPDEQPEGARIPEMRCSEGGAGSR